MNAHQAVLIVMGIITFFIFAIYINQREPIIILENKKPSQMQRGSLVIPNILSDSESGAQKTNLAETEETIKADEQSSVQGHEPVEFKEDWQTKESSVETPHNFLSETDCQEIRDTSPFYTNLKSQVVVAESKLRREGKIQDADMLREIACYPQAIWLVGKSFQDVYETALTVSTDAEKKDKVPVFSLYNLPSTSSLPWGSNIENDDYLGWITAIAEGVGSRSAWIILEPDTLSLSTQYLNNDRNTRLKELRDAIRIIKDLAPNVRVYIDAGHSSWLPPSRVADLLLQAGINEADGFSINVANYQSLSDELTYGHTISERVGNKPFVIDTSRNGLGSSGSKDWCNAPGRALGEKPTRNTNDPIVDAYFWIKLPGESDNPCNGGPAAGIFWLEYALELIQNALQI